MGNASASAGTRAAQEGKYLRNGRACDWSPYMSDIGLLLGIMNRLVDTGQPVIVTRAHLDVISQADWVTDMEPDGEQGWSGGVRGHPSSIYP